MLTVINPLMTDAKFDQKGKTNRSSVNNAMVV